jgi:hypothetical protein
MHLKAKWALFYLIVVLFSISCVCASDANVTDTIALTDEVQVDSVDVASTDLAIDGQEDNLTASSDEEVLTMENVDMNKTDSLKTSVSVESDYKIQSPNKKDIVSAKKKTVISSVKYTIAQGTYYQVNIKGADKNPIANAQVTMTIKGKDYNVKTDSGGLAKLKIGLPFGKYQIKVSFGGNGKYASASKLFNFIVGKSTYVVIGNDKLFSNGYLRVYLRSPEAFWPVAGRTLKIVVGDKEFTKVTNSEGVVVFKPGIGSKGFKFVSATFDGTSSIVGSHVTKRVACLIGNAKNPLLFKLPNKNGGPDIDYMVGNYIMCDGNGKYTILKSQYLNVMKRDSMCLFLFNKVTKYTFFKSKAEPNYNQLITRTKWNVFERYLNTKVVPKNEYKCWPSEITVSLKGKSYTYPEVRDVQDTGYTCGPTSASMCTQVLRNYVNEQYLASKSGTTSYDGSSTSGLKRGLESFNMKCTYYYKSTFQTALNELKKGGCALIFHTWNHYVAILDISKDGSKVLVGNPSGDYDEGSHGIPTNWLTVDYMYDCFNDYDTSGLIVKLNYALSKSSKNQMNNFYQNMGAFLGKDTNERIPNVG